MQNILSLTLLLGISTLTAASTKAAVVTSKQLSNGAQYSVDGGTLRIQFWSPEIVRVTYAISNELPTNKSLSVVAGQQSVQLARQDDGQSFSLASQNIKVRIDRQNGAVTFLDNVGQVLLGEEPQSRKIEPNRIVGDAVTSCAQTFALSASEGIYGLGQHQQGAWNYLNSGTVKLAQANMEVGIPVMTSSKGYMLLWDNPAMTTISPGKSESSSNGQKLLQWQSEYGKAIDYYFCYGDGKIDTALKAYRHLTGETPMMPKWEFGLWQCKERYASQDELVGVAKKMRELKVPADGIIQDWQYWPPGTNTWGSHLFDPNRYPNPVEMFKELHENHFHALISVWAKFDLGSKNSEELNAGGGMFPEITQYYKPEGQGQWYDPFSAAGRRIYWKQMREELFSRGVDGWWLDAPEPEIREMAFRTYQTPLGPGYEVYNAFPLVHSMGIYQGQRAAMESKRVVILTRSAYAGQQRNSAITWSGDIKGTWQVLKNQIPAGLNFSLSGIPYWNTDTGGFYCMPETGNGDPGNPLFQEFFSRWFQFSAFCPMFRVHGSYKLNPGREFWRFDEKTQGVMRSFLDLRYRLLPYLYSTAWQVTSAGTTFMRPLVMDFPNDPAVVGIGSQYLFGPAIMVTPVTKAGATNIPVYLPATSAPWYNFWTGETVAAGQRIETAAPVETLPLFVKPGSIIPMGPFLQYTGEKPADPIEVRVYRGADGEFTLYDDEGDDYNYENGKYATIPISWNEASQTLEIGKRTGSYSGQLKKRTFNIVWVSHNHGFGVPITEKPDAVVQYTRDAVVIKAPNKP